MAMMPKALLLDLDGTLANSLSVMRSVYEQFLEKFGIKASDAEFNSLNGPPLTEIIQRLKIKHSIQGKTEDLFNQYCALLDQAYLKVITNPGANELLTEATSASCIVGIVTSNSLNRTSAWLESVNLAKFVNFIVAAEDVLNGKPDPEPYQLAIARLNLPTHSIIAVEDSPQGAYSALRAGIKTFVLNSVSLPQQWPEGVETIPSLYHLIKQFSYNTNKDSPNLKNTHS